jgi:hypothetical protein
MPLPEGYLPRQGDVLSVDVVVKHDVRNDDSYVFTKVIGSHGDIAFAVDDPDVRVRLKRRSWNEGESVIHRAHPRWWGEIVSTHGDHVVVALNVDADPRGSVGRLRIFHCNELLPYPERPETGTTVTLPATLKAGESFTITNKGDDPVMVRPPLTEHVTLKEKPDGVDL